ncbi:MAG: HEAT repeat domain-containing protein [Proteobacteria bacterium]|nr:HEAT repeat domain-containing protein [Pseudomonadota bacterium]
MDIFSLKRETNDILSSVKKGPFSLAIIEKSAKKLADLGDGAVPFVLKYLEKEKDPAAIKKVAYLIELLNDHAYAAMLHTLLVSSKYQSISRKVKVELLATLKSYDESSFQEYFSHLFGGSDKTYLLWIKRVLEDFDSREYRTISLLEEFLGHGNKKISLIKEIRLLFKEKAVPFLAILADSDNQEVSSEALRELGTIRHEKAIKSLKSILNSSWQKEVILGAEKALRRLSFSGIDVNNVSPPLTPLPDLSQSRAFISPIDGMGNINLCIAVKSKGKRMETLCLVINDEVGILDVYGSKKMKEIDFQTMVEEISEETVFIEGEIDYAIALLNHALYQNNSRAIYLPPEFHYRKALLTGHLNPEAFLPQFQLSQLKKIKKNKILLGRSAELLDSDDFSHWVITIPRSFDYAEKMNALQQGSNKLFEMKEKRLIDDFCQEIISPMKAVLRSRLFLMADFLMKTNRGEELTLLTLATALNMGERSKINITTIPFLRKLAQESIAHCIEAIEEGFDLRDFSEELDDLDE